MYWNIGTTSFRVGNHIEKNKILLNCLQEFWQKHKSWDNVSQIDFYDIAFNHNLVKGTAARKDKDARQITSGLVELGLINKMRVISNVGYAILDEKPSLDPLFFLEYDNFIYLKQLLKLQINNIRPFIIFIYLLDKLNYLTYDEFTFILPVLNSPQEVIDSIPKIVESRNNNSDLDSFLISQISKESKLNDLMINFVNKDELSLDDFIAIDMNRKSKQYSAPLLDIYFDLFNYFNNKSLQNISFLKTIKSDLKKLSSCLYSQYSKIFHLDINLIDSNETKVVNFINNTFLMKSKDIKEFKQNFFYLVHLCKWKSNLVDYADLNKRYFMLANIIKFDKNKFELDILPKYIFHNIIDNLLIYPIEDNFDQYRSLLEDNCSLIDINNLFNVDLDNIIDKIKIDYNLDYLNKDNLHNFIYDNKLQQINKIIDNYFMPDQLITLFGYIENRNDKALKGYANIDSEVTTSTIFEYIVAIAWYHISNRSGDILKFMHLKLDANMLPITHAPAYYSDIVFNYNDSSYYPNHDLLIEVTLSDSTNQRKMEMESVSRHLVNYINAVDVNCYAVFIANELNKMVLSDFRGRRLYFYENKGEIKQGLKIIPLSTEDLSNILKNHLYYNDLYTFFETVYNNNNYNDLEWYDKCLKVGLKSFYDTKNSI